jgi:hypothetical protein
VAITSEEEEKRNCCFDGPLIAELFMTLFNNIEK